MTEPFVRVPRPLFDAVTRAKLPGSETRIALYLLGQSIGWQRSETEGYASIAAVARGSGCGRRTAIQAIRSLCARGLVVRVTRGGPGKGASSYKLAPASEWARTSEQDRTSKPHPVSEQECTRGRLVPSEQDRTIHSEQDRTIGSEQECTLIKKSKRRIKEELPPYPPEGVREIAGMTVDDLRHRLGLRGLVPPLQVERWIGIVGQGEDVVLSALGKSAGAANPAAYFLALFDADGRAKPDLPAPRFRRSNGGWDETAEEQLDRIFGPETAEEVAQ